MPVLKIQNEPETRALYFEISNTAGRRKWR